MQISQVPSTQQATSASTLHSKSPKSRKHIAPIVLSIVASSYISSLHAQIDQTHQENNPQEEVSQESAQTSDSTQAPQETAQATSPQESTDSARDSAQSVANPATPTTFAPPSTPNTDSTDNAPSTITTPTAPSTKTTAKTPYETKELDRVVTTGSALASDIASIPGNTSVINAKTITTQANTKILDVVNKQAGVHVENNASFLPRPKVKIRGINYGTLVLLDGVILSDLEGEARILSQIFLNEVERVEIARGASSAIYGTGAIGGAINFITSMPKSLEIKAVAGYGSGFVNEADRHTTSAYLSVGNAFFNKRLKLKIHGGFKRSDAYTGHPAYTSTNPNGSVIGHYQDNKGRYILGSTGERELYIYDAGIKASYELGERDEISATFRVSNHNYDAKNYKTNLRDSSGNPTFMINNKNYFVGSGNGGAGTYTNILGSIDYLHSFDDSVFRIKASSLNLLSKWQDADGWGKNSTQEEYDFKGGPGRGQDIDTSNNYLDFTYENFANESQTFTLGAQARYHKIRQDTPKLSNWRDYNSRNGVFNTYGAEVFIASLYASLNSTWVDSDKYGKFGTTLAGRFDNWVDFNNFVRDYENSTDAQTNRDFKTNYLPVFSPNVSLHYTPLDSFGFSSSPQSLTLKTNIGYGFRMPTMRERFYFGSGRAHNPDLKHEQALSFEIGAEYASKWINTSLYFYNIEMFDGVFMTGSRSDTNNPQMRKNIGRSRINGIEYSLDLPIYDALSFIANYTLTNTTILNGANKGNYLPAIPLHSANFTLSYAPTKGFYSSLWTHYTSAFFYDDTNAHKWGALEDYDEQFTLNAKAGYVFANGIDISAQFLNMTNNRYWDYYKVAGASFYLQLAYNYKAK